MATAEAAAAVRVQKQRQFVEHRDPIFPARPLSGRGVSWDSCTKHRGILQNQWRLCPWTPCDGGAKAGPRLLTHWLSSWCVRTFFKRDPLFMFSFGVSPEWFLFLCAPQCFGASPGAVSRCLRFLSGAMERCSEARTPGQRRQPHLRSSASLEWTTAPRTWAPPLDATCTSEPFAETIKAAGSS